MIQTIPPITQWSARKLPISSAGLKNFSNYGILHSITIIDDEESFCDVLPGVYSLKVPFAQLDDCQTAEGYLQTLLSCLDRSMKVRESLDGARILDIDFREMMKDPLECVRRIYRHFDYALPPEMEAKMRQALQESPRHKHGVHRYTLEQFGLAADTIRRQFAPYCERFQIAAT